MNVKTIKDIIHRCSNIFSFEFNGFEGNVDPYYIPETKSYEYLLFFNGNEQTVNDLDLVMNTPFIDGHSLTAIADKITVTEY